MAGRDLFADDPPKRGRNLFADESPAGVVGRETLTDSGSLPAPIAEGAGALNRGFAAIADFPIEAANYLIGVASKNPALKASLGAVLEPITKDDGTLPTATEGLKAIDPRFGAENFMEPGLARDAVKGLEVVPGAATAFVGSAPVASKITADLAEEASRRAATTGAKIRAGDTSAVRQTVNAAGQAVKDPQANAAIRQGFDEKVVARVKQVSDATRARMAKMVDLKERGLKVAGFAEKSRPADEVGNAVADRVHFISRVNRRAGQEIGKQAEKLKGQKVNIADAQARLIARLKEEGINVVDDAVDLAGTPYEGMGTVDDLLNLVLRQTRAAGDDAYKAHRLKRAIDKRVSFGKRSEGGLDPDIANIVKEYRRNIDQALDTQFDAYRIPNETYAQTRAALDQYQDAVGKRVDFTEANIGNRLGQLSRRLFSNAESRVTQMNALEGLDDVARANGMKVDEDVFALARFADELERVFKPSQTTDLRASVARSAADVAERGPSRVAVDRAIESGLERVVGVSEDNQLRAIRDLLSQ